MGPSLVVWAGAPSSTRKRTLSKCGHGTYDKTFVQLQRASGEEGDQATRKVAGGTLYSHVRDIEVAGAGGRAMLFSGQLLGSLDESCQLCAASRDDDGF